MTKLLQQCFLFFIVVVIPGHNLGNSQVSVNRTIGPTLVGKCKKGPCHEKTVFGVLRPGQSQTGLYSHRRLLEAGNLGFRK